MPKIKRLFHTLRYLKPVQIYGRLLSHLYRPKPNLRVRPETRPHSSKWCEAAHPEPSLLGSALFCFLNEEREISKAGDWNHPGWDKLWLYNLHYFDDLNAKGAEGRESWHTDLIKKWIDENPPGQGNGWEPYPLSLRITNWIKWVLSGNTLSEEAVQSLAVQTRYLNRRLEKHLLGNHLLANAKALLFAGYYFKGTEADSWRTTGEKILFEQLHEQILPDGGHFERSPMYHAMILEDLLDLINITKAFGQIPHSTWIDAVGKMLVWLAGMLHPDGEIVLFNDAAFGITPHPKEIFSYADRLGLKKNFIVDEGLVNYKNTGYLRLHKGPARAFLDVAPVGPDYLPGHAHADTLNFELSLFGHRAIVDSGTSLYGSSPERLRQRGTAAHNTVIIDGEDSSEVWSGFRVARRARPIDLMVEEKTDMIKVACSHDGYKRLSGKPVHRRIWQLTDGYLQVSDSIIGRFQEAVGRFHFHPKVRLEAEKSYRRGKITLPTQQKVRWEIQKGHASLQHSTYHPEFGLSIDNQCLEIELDGGESHIVFRWD
jgi:uncharacterized heparinase superfamily protein